MSSRSPLRLRILSRILLFVVVGRIDVSGMEYATALAKRAEKDRLPIIIATSHLSNLDMLVAIRILAPFFDLRIITKSIHHSFLRRPIDYLALSAGGWQNFLPISYMGERPLFVAADFEPMREALGKGRAVMIAAHNPAKEWKLPERSGYGAVYLAQLSRAMILPVTIDVQSDTPVGIIDFLPQGTVWQKVRAFLHRPVVKMSIHPAVEFPSFKGIEILERGAPKEECREVRKSLLEQGESIMKILASGLPPSKRGSR